MDMRIQRELIVILPKLRRFALGLTRDISAADDLVQSACEKAITRIHQWEYGTRLDSWMFRIIQTTHIDLIRTQKHRSTHLECIQNAETPVHDGVADVEARLTLDHVRRAINSLPEDQRAVVMLVSVEGCSYKEAADILEIPMGTLTSRLVRARTVLLRLLDGTAAVDEKTSNSFQPPYVPVPCLKGGV